MYTMLYFITGNQNKFREFETILGKETIQQLDIDLPEIQELDPHKIIQEKISEALKHHPGPLLIEDTSLYFDCLWGKLPWPLIKRFLQELGNEWLYTLTKNFANHKAKARVLIWYAENKDSIQFFEWSIQWTIVEPKLATTFWWNPIFQPLGYNKTLQAMTQEEKNQISMRAIALNKLKQFLEKQKQHHHSNTKKKH
jgi:inosine triphosphate pyrophosphatase